MNYDKRIEEYLEEQIKCISSFNINHKQTIQKIFTTIQLARDTSKTIFIMGNGGSASTASHFATDLLKTSIVKNRDRFKAVSLSDNIPVMLAWANDTSYDDIFVEQLRNCLSENDIVIGISGSGNSTNVIKAIEFANATKALTISLTGKDGGKLSKHSQINLTVPSNDMLTIETMHLMLFHLLVTMNRDQGEPLFSY